MNAKAASNGGLSAFRLLIAFQAGNPMDISDPAIKIKAVLDEPVAAEET